MSRPIRIHLSGVWYHVTARGIDRRVIFTEAAEYRHFQELLAELTKQYRVHLHAYVLMTNHFHLVLETPDRNLSAAMQWLKTSYSMWFNRRHRRVGPLFQGRYKAELFEPHEAGWAVTRYVHLNPVRVKGWMLDKSNRGLEASGIAAGPSAAVVRQRISYLQKYRWSSYPYYLGEGDGVVPVRTCDVMKLSGAKKDHDQRMAYRRYVEESLRSGRVEGPWEELVGGVVLGKKLLKKVAEKIKGDPREQPGMPDLADRPSFHEVVVAMESVKGEAWEQFVNRAGDPGRDIVLDIARRRCGLTLKELGEAAGGLDYRCVATAIRRIRSRIQNDRAKQTLMVNVEANLTNVKT